MILHKQSNPPMLGNLFAKHFVLWLIMMTFFLSSCAMPQRSGYSRKIGDWPAENTRKTVASPTKPNPSGNGTLDPQINKPKTIYAPKIQGNLRKITDSWIGTPYLFGAQSKGKGTDCSGLVTEVMKDYLGITLPRHSQSLFLQGKEIEPDDLKVGDILFYGPGSYIDHTAIYMGDGIFCHASSSAGVEYRNMDDNYWNKRYKGARRYGP